ncbi:MAG: hypothetical protein WAT71_07575 [Ignavibacteria bacterium]
MKPTIFFTLLIIILSLQTSLFKESIVKNNESSFHSINLDITYVKVFDNGHWWIYVYDGTVLIDRYLLED